MKILSKKLKQVLVYSFVFCAPAIAHSYPYAVVDRFRGEYYLTSISCSKNGKPYSPYSSYQTVKFWWSDKGPPDQLGGNYRILFDGKGITSWKMYETNEREKKAWIEIKSNKSFSYNVLDENDWGRSNQTWTFELLDEKNIKIKESYISLDNQYSNTCISKWYKYKDR